MDAMILLVLLTLKDSGPLGVNFVEFRDVSSCEARAEQLTDVLVKAGIKVVESSCVMGVQHFTPHRHRSRKGGAAKDRPEKKFAYLLALDRQRVLAMPKHDMQVCERERRRLEAKVDERARKNGVRYYCAASEQMLIDDGRP